MSGKHLEIYYVPDELQKEQIPELNKIISETNQVYRQYIMRMQHEANAQAAKDADEMAKLAEIKSTLKFD